MIEREKHRTRGGEWTLSGVRLEEKKSAEQWKEMRNLFEWFWIIDKFQWFFFLASHRQWILSKTCDNFTILKHKHNHKYKCSTLNATPLILHLDATQSHAYEMCVRRSFFLSSYWKATTTSSSSNSCNRSNVLVPFFHVIPISEHWLNLRSRLLLLFYRKLCFFSLLQCIWNVTCLFCLVLRHWFRCKILGAHNEPFGLRLKTWLLCDFSRCFFFSLGAFSLCRSHRSYGSSCRSSVWIVPLPPSLPCQTVASWLDVLHFMLKHCYHCCNASKYTIMSKKTPWWFNYLLLFFKRTRYLIRFQCSRRQQSIREQDK